MHMLKQMDPDLYLEVLRKQAQVWDDLIAAFEDTWTRWAKLPWTPENSRKTHTFQGGVTSKS